MIHKDAGRYEIVAGEYYDPGLHPTCANFRVASSHFLKGMLPAYRGPRGWWCEVGPGRSLLSEWLDAGGYGLRELVLIDSSPTMLGYSAPWKARGAQLVLGSAEALPIATGRISLLVASLGDPYNLPSFWAEVARVLRPGGVVLFTTPSYQWASSFRDNGEVASMTSAEFLLSDGRKAYMPSFIRPESEQAEMIRECGLQVGPIVPVPLSALGDALVSPKVLGLIEPIIVTGYVATKPGF